MKAIVSVTFDDEFVVHDIRVIEGTNGFLLLCLVGKAMMESIEI